MLDEIVCGNAAKFARVFFGSKLGLILIYYMKSKIFGHFLKMICTTVGLAWR